MDLHRYYAKNKDDINSSIMEIASDLAVGRMVDKYKQPFEAFVEPDDLDDPDSGTHYKEEFQDEYNQFYDEEYERVASLMQFDIGTEDGIRRDGTDDPISSLVSRANAWQQEAREQIVEEQTCIMADGIDSDGDKRIGFQFYDGQLYDIALFLKYVL